MKSQFNERNVKTQELLRRVMETADRTIWRCDPVNHVEGETYEQVTRLMQGYIENEVDLNSDGTCMENCAAYQYTESHGCFKDKFCSKQPKCNGKILHCRYIDSDMWICPAVSHVLPISNLKFSFRRKLPHTVAMTTLSTKMEKFLDDKIDARVEQIKWIHGGATYSGIVAIVSACATKKARDPTDISIYAKLCLMSQTTSKSARCLLIQFE